MSNSTTQLTKITAEQLEDVNAKLEKLTPHQIIRWACESVGSGRIAVLSAMQEAGCILCHMVKESGLSGKMDVIFVDTGVNFPETLETAARVSDAYGLNLVTLKPERTMAEQTAEEGVLYLSKDGQKRCCHLRKKVPLRQIIGKYDALLVSLRRGSGGKRSDVPVLAVDSELNLLRIHPIVLMTDEQMDEYLAAHKVIINPLHAQGYPTVSCNRCTTPVLPGEDDRAGRWRHLEHEDKYCNINPTDRKRVRDNSDFVELASETAVKILNFEI
ncbi:phosphoadenylyl-sulfate reductase [Candidatus Sumerlaeota bacterium]|nr:phosphoadenylyl-sulfate reductase [Candidatus Sumerlaeota bacterium]